MEIWSKISKKNIIAYVKSTRCNDGGYVHYRMPPSSGLDTFYALSILKLLGEKITHKEETVNFIESLAGPENVNDLYIIIKCHQLLGRSVAEFNDRVKNLISLYLAEFVSKDKELFYDVVSIFEQASKALELTQLFDLKIKKEPLKKKVLSCQKPSGGFGKNYSKLADTFYAVKILSQIGCFDEKVKDRALQYLKNRRFYQFSDSRFIEDIYYLAEIHQLLSIPLPNPDGFLYFISNCQKNGGFARNYPQAIVTLEYTYMAARTLMTLGRNDRISDS